MKFSQTVITDAAPYWERATNHAFIAEMVDGSLDTKAFSHYLVQDYAFVHAFLDLVSHTIAFSQTIEQKHRLSTFLSMVSSDENDYFLRSFEALEVPESQYLAPNLTLSPALQGFQQMIADAINSEGDNNHKYQQCLILLACAEMVYCEWGVKHSAQQPEQFYFNEWITLHNNDFFQSFVAWLKSELDALQELPEHKRQQLSKQFTAMCQLEAQFFDECYAGA